MCGPHHCLRRGASAPNPAILCGLLQLRQNASILEQGCAGFSPGSANRWHQFTRHPWRTSPSLRPSLSFRYTPGCPTASDRANRNVPPQFGYWLGTRAKRELGTQPSTWHSTIAEKCFEFIARVRHVGVGVNGSEKVREQCARTPSFF